MHSSNPSSSAAANTEGGTSDSSSSSTTSNASSRQAPGQNPIYRGVRRRSSGKWVSEIREPKKPSKIWLGTFNTAEMAVAAYDVAALALKGKEAKLNFPRTASSLPVPASTSPRDIQAAAAGAAAAAARAARDALTAWSEPDLQLRGESNPVPPDTCEGYRNAAGNEFFDEEFIFDMPNVLTNMAEGMLLSPPRLDVGGDDDFVHETTEDQELWKFP